VKNSHKSATCLLRDDEAKAYLKGDFDVYEKYSGQGVVKMIDSKEDEDNEIGEFVIEALYEHFETNLLSLIGNEEAGNIMDMMTSVALTMECLQKLEINHGDLKPENMVTRDGIVKLINFGLARDIF